MKKTETKKIKVSPASLNNAVVSQTNKDISKLELGCGTRRDHHDWIGVDKIKFEGVDVVLDLMEKLPNGQFKPWPWKDASIDEISCSHVVEHFEPAERIHFVNEMYRILKPGAKATVVAPDWSTQRAYGDLTHKWPPISGFWFFYLSEEWRKIQAPHNLDYKCNFSVTWGHIMREDVAKRNTEFQMFAMANYKDVCLDIIATLIAVK